MENLPKDLNLLKVSSNRILKLENLPENLKSLTISNNNVEVLENLPKGLDFFNISSNNISKLENLPRALASLNISSNQIQKLENLPEKLRSLDIASNLIESLGGSLKSLKSLNISFNKISVIPFSIFKQFDEYDIGEYIPRGSFFYDSIIDVSNNDIISPPLEILQQGWLSVLDWFEANKKELKEIKIILLGDPKAGKTSLLRKLKEDTFNEQEEQTDGINIESIEFGDNPYFEKQTNLHDLTGHFWDFGGQEIMNATHQFFLTKRSVYVLVLDARKDTDVGNQVREWMKKISITGGNSPVLIVANQIDRNPGFGFENEYELQQEFPQIESFFTISCKNGTSVEVIKEKLSELIPKAELFHTEIDERWINIKEQLQKETKDNHFLNENRFLEICRTHELTNPSGQSNVIEFLNQLGLVLHFKEVDLAEYFVLDPYWITYGIYQILTSKYAGDEKGKVGMDKLKYIINEEEDKREAYKPKNFKRITYSQNECRFLVDILNQFKLCFYLPDRKYFILPDLLNTLEPIDQTVPIRNSKDSIRFVYKYDYLPKSIMPYVMVKAHKILETTWRTGCIINKDNCRALISVYKNQLTIIVIGKHKQKREFMSVVRYLIDGIHREIGIKPEMLIPLPEEMGLVDYEELLEKESDGERYHSIYKPQKRKFEISILLEGISKLDYSEESNQSLKEKLDEVLSNQNEIKSDLGDIKDEVMSFTAALERIESGINSLNPPDLNQINKVLESKLGDFIKELPTSNDIAKEWKEMNRKGLLNMDAKAKLKWQIKIFGLVYEKELSTDVKASRKAAWKHLKAMSKEILECGRGERTLKELFIEGEDQNLLDSGE